jgi:hypothetical protein
MVINGYLRTLNGYFSYYYSDLHEYLKVFQGFSGYYLANESHTIFQDVRKCIPLLFYPWQDMNLFLLIHIFILFKLGGRC